MPRTNEKKDRLNISLTVNSLQYTMDELSKVNFEADDFENYYAADKKTALYGNEKNNEKIRMFVDTLLDLRKMYNEQRFTIGVSEHENEKYKKFFENFRNSATMTAFHKAVRNSMLEFAANEGTMPDSQKLFKLQEYDELLTEMTGDQLKKEIEKTNQKNADKVFQTIIKNSADNYLYDTAIGLKRSGDKTSVYFDQYLKQSREIEKIKNGEINAKNEDEKNKIAAFFNEKSEAEEKRILENEEARVKIDLEKEVILSEKENDQRAVKAEERSTDVFRQVLEPEMKKEAAEMSKKENEIYALCDKLEKNLVSLQAMGRKDTSQEYKTMIEAFEALKKSRYVRKEYSRGKVEASIRDNMCLDADGNSVFGWDDNWVDTGLNSYIDDAVKAAHAYRTKKEQGALSERIKSSFFTGKQRYKSAVDMETDLTTLKTKLNDYNNWKKGRLDFERSGFDSYQRQKSYLDKGRREKLDAGLNLKRADDLISKKNAESAKLEKKNNISLTRLDRYVKINEKDKTRAKTSIKEMRNDLNEKIDKKRKEAKVKYSGEKDLSWKVKVEPQKRGKVK